MKKPKDKIIRKYLNKKGHHTIASVLAMCKYNDYGSCLTLKISDCSKVIELDIEANTKKELSNIKFKLKTLKETIEFLENEVNIAWDWGEKVKKRK